MANGKENPLDNLSVRERIFCQEYVVSSHGIQSAKEAGYKGADTSLKVTASKLLKKPKIKAAIAYLIKPNLEEANITAERVLKELERVTFRRIKDFVDDDGYLITKLSDVPDDVAACIDGWDVRTYYKKTENGDKEIDYQEIKVRLVPKLPAVEIAMKYLKMLGPDLKVGKLQINHFQQIIERSLAPIEDPVGARLKVIESGGK